MFTYIEYFTSCLLQSFFCGTFTDKESVYNLLRVGSIVGNKTTCYHFLSSRIRFFKAYSCKFMLAILFC